MNAAHEVQPILAQDADGRYLLAFSSDRNLTRNQAIYFTWTFDFQHFAAPIQVLSDSGRALKLLCGDDGQLRCYAYIEPIRRVGRSTGPTPTLAMIESSNLVHWSPYVEFFSPYPDAPSKSRLLRSLFIVKGGGRYRLFADEAGSYPLTSDSGDGTISPRRRSCRFRFRGCPRDPRAFLGSMTTAIICGCRCPKPLTLPNRASVPGSVSTWNGRWSASLSQPNSARQHRKRWASSTDRRSRSPSMAGNEPGARSLSPSGTVQCGGDLAVRPKCRSR